MQYITKGKFLIVDIRKPLGIQPDYDFVRVRKDFFDKAWKLHKNVLVTSPNGERIFSKDNIKGMNVVDEVFLFPDNPMKMYELTIPHVEKKPMEYYEFF